MSETTWVISYRKNTLQRGWVFKTKEYIGTGEDVSSLIRKMNEHPSFRVLEVNLKFVNE